MTGDKTNSVSNIWTVQANLIHFYKMTTLGLGATVIIASVFALIAYFRNPIVVVRRGAEQEFYSTLRAPVTLGKPDVDHFIRDYLKSLYVWDSFDLQKLAGDIAPFSDESLVPKILANQKQKFGKLVDKKLLQDVAFVAVNVLDTRVTCSFLRILQIEGIPLVVPTELSFSLIQGSRTRANPIGIYVSGIVENEHAK